MKHDSFERNSALENRPKNPFVVRCDVILLKHALTKAESELQTRIVTGFNLVNINPALGYIRSAILDLKILLKRDCIASEDMFSVADLLHSAYKQAPLPEILAAWEQSLDFIADLPIPYRVIEAEFPIGVIVPKKCKCGNDLKVSEELARGFCVHCANAWHDEPESSPIPAFDNSLVTGDIRNQGEWHRCIVIARKLLEKSLWDGDCKLHICGDVDEMHRQISLMDKEPFVGKFYTHEYDNDGTAFAYLNIMDVPVGGAK